MRSEAGDDQSVRGLPEIRLRRRDPGIRWFQSSGRMPLWSEGKIPVLSLLGVLRHRRAEVLRQSVILQRVCEGKELFRSRLRSGPASRVEGQLSRPLGLRQGRRPGPEADSSLEPAWGLDRKT